MSEVTYYGVCRHGEFRVTGKSDDQAIERFHYLRNKFPALRRSKLVKETREDLILVDPESLND